MANPKKIKSVMPAPKRRNFVVLGMIKNSAKAGSHSDFRKSKMRNACREKHNHMEGW